MVFKPLVTDIVGSFTGGLRLYATGAGYSDVVGVLDSFLVQSAAFASAVLDTDALADNYDRTAVETVSDVVLFLAGDVNTVLPSGMSTNFGEPDQSKGNGNGSTLDDDLAAIAALVAAKGTLLVGNGVTWEALDAGTNDTVLTADDTDPKGVVWRAPTGGGGSTDADSVTYTTSADPSVVSVADALDKLLYVAPNITSLSGGGSYEIGSTVAGVHLAWSINKAVTSQSLNNGIGALAVDARTYDYAPDITSNITFTLTVSDGQTNDVASTSVQFLRKRYWGASASASLDNAGILALSSELTSSKNKSVTYDCTGGKYPYFCYPKSFGALSAVTVGGLAFSDYTQTELSFTNASGHTELYYVTKFNGIQTGANIAVVWA